MTGRLAALVVGLLGAATLVAASYRLGRAEGADRSPQSLWPGPEPAKPGALTDLARPRAVSAGSLFRNRFAAAESPLDGVEAVLVTARAVECLDSCPVALRVAGGARGAADLAKVGGSMRASLELLADDPDLPPLLGRAIPEALRALALSGGDSGPARAAAVRALFINQPRPEWARNAWSVGLAFYNHPDFHFDPSVAAEDPGAGVQVLIARVAEPGDGAARTRLLAGALEIGWFEPGQTLHLPREAVNLGLVFGELWNHFLYVPGRVCGLYLGSDERIYLYGSDLRLVPIRVSDGFRRKFTALLRRA